MPAIPPYIPTSTINDIATKIFTARATSTTSSPPDYDSPSSIAGFVWFGIIATIVLAGSLAACFPVLIILAMPVILPWLILKKVYGGVIGPPAQRRKQRKQAAKTAQITRANELANRGRHRRQWALEELQLARKDGRAARLPQDWIAELMRACGKNSKFFELPYEIRLMIYSEFDYGTALKLEGVSKVFYNDQPAKGVDREQRATFVYHAETFRRNKDKLACYGCLRIRDRAAFEESYQMEEFARFAESELERRCFDCRVDRGEVKWAKWWKVVRYVRGHNRARSMLFKRRR